MTVKILSDKAINVINQYLNFSTGNAVCNIPYYNNKTLRVRNALRSLKGKGSPEEIREEAEYKSLQQKINLQALDSVSLKKFLVENNIGIDCSGLAYYILNAEMHGRGKGKLKLSYPLARGILGKIRTTFKPIDNTNVATLAHDKNSRIINLRFIQPGDLITMQGKGSDTVRNHILIVHEVNYRNDIVSSISYTHTISWPTDGEYDHGVRQGFIRITDIDKPINEQDWVENNKSEKENYTHERAKISKTEIRRLNWL